MAYAEKRGGYWRGRYKNPPSVAPKWGTVSADRDGLPFTEKQKALDAANDKESEIRAFVEEWKRLTAGRLDSLQGRDVVTFEEWMRVLQVLRRAANGGRDPHAGLVTFRSWVEKVWLPALDVEESTERQYRQLLRLRIYPEFGDDLVITLDDHHRFNAWELGLRRRFADNTVNSARSLLSTIVGDMVTARLLDINAAARRRRRGRVADRRERYVHTPKEWATPLQVLLIAERAAALTGRDDDFVMWITCGWCGLRWGEVMGLQRSQLHGDRLSVDVQLANPDGPFICRAPKDGSFRDDRPNFFGKVDLPPFLAELLAWQIESRPPTRCKSSRGRDGCGCGGGEFLFLDQDRTHILHRGYIDYPWRPACDGRLVPAQAREGRKSLSSRPVLADVSVGWPGVPLRPAWPEAAGQQWEPPRGRGMPHYDEAQVDELAVNCRCGAAPGAPCRTSTGRTALTHRSRRADAEAAGHSRHLALFSWLPVRPGLTPHGLRHSHRTWLEEAMLPPKIKFDRMGHAMPGIGGTYTHVTPVMREMVRDTLRRVWEDALDQRLKLAAGRPHGAPLSVVPVLARLLSEHAGAGPGVFDPWSSPGRLPKPPESGSIR